MQAFDTVAVSFFFVEYVARLLISPNKKKFVKDGMNLVKSADLFIQMNDSPISKVDLVALVPYFFSILLAGLEDLDIIGKAGKIVRLLRIMRILRIFKMVRHFVGLQSLVYTLHQAHDLLWLI